MNATEALTAARNVLFAALNENGDCEDLFAAVEAAHTILAPQCEVVPDEDDLDAELRKRSGQYDDES